MRAPTRIVFDTFDGMFAGSVTVEVDDADSSLGAIAAMADSYLTAIVTAADMLAFAGESEREVGAAAVKVVVDGASEMADTGCSGFVGAELEGRFRGVFGADGGFIGIDFWEGCGCCDRGWGLVVDCLSFGVSAAGGVGLETPEILELAETYSWLKHY